MQCHSLEYLGHNQVLDPHQYMSNCKPSGPTWPLYETTLSHNVWWTYACWITLLNYSTVYLGYNCSPPMPSCRSRCPEAGIKWCIQHVQAPCYIGWSRPDEKSCTFSHQLRRFYIWYNLKMNHNCPWNECTNEIRFQWDCLFFLVSWFYKFLITCMMSFLFCMV